MHGSVPKCGKERRHGTVWASSEREAISGVTSVQAEVLIAIISAVAGVISAIIAWIQTIRTTRLKASVDISLERIKSETALALEVIKIENERRGKAFEVASQACAPTETALDQAWQDIQTVKDVIARLLSPIRYDHDIALNALRPTVLSIENGYHKHGASIPETARSAWHRAKHCTSLVEHTVSEHAQTRSLSNEVVETLKNFRRELTDQQLAMIAARESLRSALVERILRLI